MSRTCNLRDCGKCGKSPRKYLNSLWRAVCGKCGKSPRKSLIFGGMWCGKCCGMWPPHTPPLHPAPSVGEAREVLTGLEGKKKERAGRLRLAAEGGTLVVGSGLRPAAFGGSWYRVVRA